MRHTPSVTTRLAFAFALLITAAACQDDKTRSSAIATAPGAARLTVRTLPSDAPTICVANVRQRDKLLAISKPTTATTRQINALNDVIDDVCKY
jgi:hypothetical protein